MTKLCGNCFFFAILPSCKKLHRPGSPACGEWSPNAKVALWQLEQEKQDRQTIAAMVAYLAAECVRCPGYRKGGKGEGKAGCLMADEGRDDCEAWIAEWFAGAGEKKKAG